MNDNEPMQIGDRVQLREFPYVRGVVWDMTGDGTVIVGWDDPEEDVYVRNPRQHLQKLPRVPLSPAQ